MMVHRLLARYLADGKAADKTMLEDLCFRASEREVIAAEAERASIKYKMVEFMKEHIGEEFEGHISGLTEWGNLCRTGRDPYRGHVVPARHRRRLLPVRRGQLPDHRPLDGPTHDAGRRRAHPRQTRRPAETPARLRGAARRTPHPCARRRAGGPQVRRSNRRKNR